MPRISFTTENQVKNYNDYPKLSLDKGERARVCLVDPEPMMKWTHSFRMPIVIDGEIQTETKQGKRGDYEVNKTDFAGIHQCLGLDEIMEKPEHLDPEHCLSCKMHLEHPEWFEAPKRRFAQHIIKYLVQPGKFTPQEPFQVELLAWVYADRRFDEIVEIAQEHGDPRGVDLNLGPCEVKLFQKFDINVAGKCEWIQNDERKKLVVELMKNNQCKDLETLIAKKLTPLQIQMDVDRVTDRWGEVGAADKFDSAESVTASLAASSTLDDIFNESASAKAAMPAPATPPVAAASMPAEFTSPPAVPEMFSPAAEAAKPAPAPVAAKTAPEPAPDVASSDVFDDILAGL